MELRSRSCDWLLGISIFLTNSLLFLLLLFQKACFVDFQKAYDTIWRNGLFYKLMKYGFSHKIVFLLKSKYDRVASAVKVKSGLTATFTPLVGVRQGCKLIACKWHCWYIWLHLWSLDHGRIQNQLFAICRWSYPAFRIRTWFEEMPW